MIKKEFSMIKYEIKNFEDFKKAKHELFGDNSEIRNLQKQIKSASFEKRKIIGEQIKSLKIQIDNFLNKEKIKLESKIVEAKIKNEWIDIHEPVNVNGFLHPLTLIENRFKNWLNKNGYYQAKTNEIEDEKYNFERLNIPQDHPSRDMHDSLYITKNRLLATHNTASSAREIEKNTNKSFKCYAIGKVYRNDEDDATHSHQFTQIDIIAVGSYSIPNLIWVLKNLLSYVLETEIKLRLRPSFFPFTEPSLEVDIFYNNKWIEVLGSGMIHNKVLKKGGYTNKMNGIAIGIGIERIAMIKYNIDEIKEFYKNDLRFLKQFKGAN